MGAHGDGGRRVEPRPVVVGIDDTAHARQAARWAGVEAGRQGVPLRLVAVTGLVGEHLPGGAGRRRGLEAVLARALAAAEAAGAGAVGTAVRSGVPAAVLAEESHAARLVVVGDRGASRFEGVLVGSVAVTLLGRAECPVVVVRGPERDAVQEAGRPVVVGLDVTTPAFAVALDVAVEAAASRGVELFAVHAVPEPVTGPVADLLVAPAAARRVLDAVEQRVLVERVTARAEHRGVPVRTVIAPGRAGKVLLAEAARAQLVVVGSRGCGELAGLVRGSVSTLLVHHAACPVLVVPPGAGRRGAVPPVPPGRAPSCARRE